MKANLIIKRNLGWLPGLLLLLIFAGCNQIQAQNKMNQPNVHIEVHRKTDKNGHVTSYDSTYTYSYIDTSGIRGGLNTDSLFEAMRQRMHSPFFGNSAMNPWQDMPGMRNFFRGMQGTPFARMDSLMRSMMQQNQAFMGMPNKAQFPGMLSTAPSDSLIPTPPSWNKNNKGASKGSNAHKEAYIYHRM